MLISFVVIYIQYFNHIGKHLKNLKVLKTCVTNRNFMNTYKHDSESICLFIHWFGGEFFKTVHPLYVTPLEYICSELTEIDMD